jgi:hypothetical protein
VRARIVALIVVLIAGIAQAQSVPPRPESFRVEWGRRSDFWRPAVDGYVHNDSDYRVGNIRLRVEMLDASNSPVSTQAMWVFGVINARDRGYFVLPLPEPGNTYRITVESFDLMARQPRVEGP